MAWYPRGMLSSRLPSRAPLADHGLEDAERTVSPVVALVVDPLVALGLLAVRRRRWGVGSAVIVVLVTLLVYLCVVSDLYIGYQ
jgi:hypothetical protein